MKTSATLLFILTITIGAQVKPPDPLVSTRSQAEISVETTIRSVTVYARSALVRRRAELNLPIGEHHLVFGLLPANVNSDSIQVSGRGACTLQDINIRDAHRSIDVKAQGQPLIDALQKKASALQELADQLERIGEAREYLEKTAEKFLDKREKEGVAVELNPDNFLKITQAIQQRRAELDLERRAAERRIEQLEREKDALNQDLQLLQEQLQATFPRVEVTIQVKSAGRLELDLTYLVREAGWGPQYELQVLSRDRTMTLIYQAQVRQNTGEDWRGVQLTLSTADPDRSSQHPGLSPLRANFLPPPQAAPSPSMQKGVQETRAEMTQNIRVNAASAMDNMYQVVGLAGNGVSSLVQPALPVMDLPDVAVSGGATAEFYEISGPSTISSDNQVHQVGIMTRSLPLHFRYSCVPKLMAKAFLKARAENSTPYTLLPGKARVFLDQSFVTTTSMGRIARNESFWTFLGVDDDIRVDYRLVKKTSGDKGFLSKKNTLEFESLITLTNHKNSEEEIVIWDQIPLSGHEDIKVNLIKPVYKGDTDQLKLTNMNYLEWFYRMKPGDKIEIPLVFVLEYPVDQKITIQ